MQKQLIVAGFHRSGTSMTTQILHESGLFVGDDLLGAAESNPHGHFEDKEIVELHDKILRENGENWKVNSDYLPVISNKYLFECEKIVEKRIIKHELWGFKDPRVCLFLPMWKSFLPDMKVLIVYRDFYECHSSFFKRHTTDLINKNGRPELHLPFWQDISLSARIWTIYNKKLLDFAHLYPDNVFVASQRMIVNGFPLVGRLNAKFDLRLKYINKTTVDRNLANHELPVMSLDEKTILEIETTTQQLNALASAKSSSYLETISRNTDQNINIEAELEAQLIQLKCNYASIRNYVENESEFKINSRKKAYL